MFADNWCIALQHYHESCENIVQHGILHVKVRTLFELHLTELFNTAVTPFNKDAEDRSR